MFYTVPASEPLSDSLARWMLDEYSSSPQDMAQALVFLPSRRVIRTVKEAFLRAGQGQAMLLPQLVAIGDIDETLILRHASPSAQIIAEIDNLLPTPPAMERLLILQNLVWQYGQEMIPSLHDREAALDLAVNLAELIDEMDREQGDWSQLDNLVPEDFAEHWQHTLNFLGIIREHWPQIELENGWMRPWQRRNELITILLNCWRDNPPQLPVIAAGTTGSIPAVSELLAEINALPSGAILLPGFDPTIGEDPLPITHPQSGMQELLLGLEILPEQVKALPIGASDKYKLRREFMSLAMSPVEAMDEWQVSEVDAVTALHDAHYLEINNSHELALSAALLMREALDIPEKTTAFITPDRQLARAASAHLARWGIKADDSAGRPLAQTSQSIFIFLLLEVARYGFKPVLLLSLIKHPLFFMQHKKADIYKAIRHIEVKVLRKITVPTWQKIKTKCSDKLPHQTAFLEEIENNILPLIDIFASKNNYSFTELVDKIIELSELLATDDNGECHLWLSDGSFELSGFFAELREASIDKPISAEDFPGMLRALMRPHVVRPQYGMHPRLRILSPMEARLQRFDRVILADLNEAGWPQSPEADAWMNRQMRHKLGLPSPDKRIGQQAHDFIQQASGGEVFFMRTVKSAGAETVPSRFMQRIEVLVETSGSDVDWKTHQIYGWLNNIMTTDKTYSATRPAPKPPVEARPRKLSVTRIERLMQDPYGIYAQKILGLNKLDALDAEPSHREFGNIVHDVLELYFTSGRDIMDCAHDIFDREDLGYIAESLWWPRFERIAEWVKAQPVPESISCEINGEWQFAAPAGNFTLTAKVDRLEKTATGFSIIDYKTGAPPSTEFMKQGIASQLTLAAVIASQGGFGGSFVNLPVDRLEYWKLGGAETGKKTAFAKEKDETFDDVVARAHEALPKIIEAYDNVDKAYESIPEFRFRPRYNDYEHLARVNEWLD